MVVYKLIACLSNMKFIGTRETYGQFGAFWLLTLQGSV